MQVVMAGPLYCYKCFKVAYLLTEDLKPGYPINLEAIRHADGSQLKRGTFLVCKHCNGDLMYNKLMHHNVVDKDEYIEHKPLRGNKYYLKIAAVAGLGVLLWQVVFWWVN